MVLIGINTQSELVRKVLSLRGANSSIQEYCTRQRLTYNTNRATQRPGTCSALGKDLFVQISCAACKETIDVSKGHCLHTCTKPALLDVSEMVEDGLVALDGEINARFCMLCGCSVDNNRPFHFCYSEILTHCMVSGHSIHSVARLTMENPVQYGITANDPEDFGCGMYISVNQIYKPSPGKDRISFTTVLIAPTPQLDQPGGRPNVGMFAISRDGNFIRNGDIIMLYVGTYAGPFVTRSNLRGNDKNACEIRSMEINKFFGRNSHGIRVLQKENVKEIRTRVDPTIYGNLVHKANQACGYLKNAFIQHPDIEDSVRGSQTVYMSMLVASETILPGIEICYYYGQTTNKKSEEEACLCLYCHPPDGQRLLKDPESKGMLCVLSD